MGTNDHGCYSNLNSRPYISFSLRRAFILLGMSGRGQEDIESELNKIIVDEI